MKKFMFIVLSMVAVGSVSLTTGCISDNIPTYEQAYRRGSAFGTVAGIVTKLAVKDKSSVQKACEIIDEIHKRIPATNETFYSCWIPLVKDDLDYLQKEKQITDEQYIRIFKVSEICCTGLDLTCEKFPKMKLYDDLTYAVVDGFDISFKREVKFEKTVASLSVDEEDVKTLCASRYIPYVPAENRN